jgi:hypothetical protein
MNDVSTWNIPILVVGTKLDKIASHEWSDLETLYSKGNLLSSLFCHHLYRPNDMLKDLSIDHLYLVSHRHTALYERSFWKFFERNAFHMMLLRFDSVSIYLLFSPSRVIEWPMHFYLDHQPMPNLNTSSTKFTSIYE